MDKSTLSGYGWVIIVTLILAVMLAFATPFGKYVGQGVSSVAKGFVESGKSAMSEDNRKQMEKEWNEFFENDPSSGSGEMPEEDNQNKIPVGAVYYTNVTPGTNDSYPWVVPESGKLTAGQEMPTTQKTGDIYVYDNYIYIYNGLKTSNCPFSLTLNGVRYNEIHTIEGLNGWGVVYMGGAIANQPLSEIAGKPIVSLQSTYYGHSELTTIQGGLVIGPAVTRTDAMFTNCTNFSGTVTLNNNTTAGTPPPFYGTGPIILKGTNPNKMSYTNHGCTHVTIQ